MYLVDSSVPSRLTCGPVRGSACRSTLTMQEEGIDEIVAGVAAARSLVLLSWKSMDLLIT